MGVYYEVLRPANENDLEAAGPEIAAVLGKLPSSGYVSTGDLKKYGEGYRRAVSWACANGVMRKAKLTGRVLRFESVRFWMDQLSAPKTRNITVNKGTRPSYAAALDAFNEWLRGREFPVRREAVRDGAVVVLSEGRSFTDVDDLLGFCVGSAHGSQAVRRILRQYLADSAAGGCSLSTALMRCSAVKSYFAVHDVPVEVSVSRNRHPDSRAREDYRMSLPDFYKMVTAGRMDVMTRAIAMIKFQAGLDSSTLADGFNFEAYGQIIRHFGTEDYDAWDLSKCPVPIRVVRVKTGMRHTTFIDRDAVSQLRDYLRWKEFRSGGRHDGTKPLFVTQRGTPVSPDWISGRFSRAAINAGIQKRVSSRAFRVHAHEVRDLLKSTLMVAGCAQYAADHVLGHAPRDSYEKQAVLYPDVIRREYAKASGLLNVLAGFERHLETAGGGGNPPETPESGGGDPYGAIQAQQAETREALRRMTETMAGVLRVILRDREEGPGDPEDVRRMIKRLEGGGPG